MAAVNSTSSNFEQLTGPKSNGQQNGNATNGNSTTTTDSTMPQKHLPSLTPMPAPAHEQPKKYEDILAYEDKWVGWDGPVWCSRYGRFENQEDAAADHGYKSIGQIPHQELTGHPDLRLQRCERHGCACRAPFEHRSYVQDIQRRVEPMVATLVGLEHQVAKMVQHMVKNGEEMLHDDGVKKPHDGQERFAIHDGPFHAEHFEKRREPMHETITKLEAQVHTLTHQLQQMRVEQELARRGGEAKENKKDPGGEALYGSIV